MAARTILIDDLDESEGGVTTVQFALDGREYEIDLSAGNSEQLRKVLDPYIQNARLTGTKKAGKTSSKSDKRSRDDLAEIRAWAKDNGFAIGDRGRIPGEVRKAFDAARHSNAA